MSIISIIDKIRFLEKQTELFLASVLMVSMVVFFLTNVSVLRGIWIFLWGGKLLTIRNIAFYFLVFPVWFFWCNWFIIVTVSFPFLFLAWDNVFFGEEIPFFTLFLCVYFIFIFLVTFFFKVTHNVLFFSKLFNWLNKFFGPELLLETVGNSPGTRVSNMLYYAPLIPLIVADFAFAQRASDLASVQFNYGTPEHLKLSREISNTYYQTSLPFRGFANIFTAFRR